MSYDEQPVLDGEPMVQKAARTSFAPRALDLWIEGVEPALSVRHVSVREQLSDLFSLTILPMRGARGRSRCATSTFAIRPCRLPPWPPARRGFSSGGA